jgi:hypothetical protein
VAAPRRETLAASLKTKTIMETMIKYTITILLTLLQFGLMGQNQKPGTKKIIKTGQIFTNKKLSFYYENDKNGNTIFSKNDGMNGDITMLFISEYDSLNRETRIFFAHSNIGFSLSEKVYDSTKIYHYEYEGEKDTINSFERDTLNKIDSQLEFLQLNAIKSLLKSKRQLKEIELVDSMGNVITEIYFSENGDTSSINSHVYDSNNKEIIFHYGLRNKEPWVWDIYYLYDNSFNKIKSIRLSSKNGIKDTTEVYTYHYNSQNLLFSEDYYNKKQFINKTDCFYNKNQKIIEEHFYEGEEFVLDVKTNYKYDKDGNLIKKVQKDYRQQKKDRKNIYTYKLRYW